MKREEEGAEEKRLHDARMSHDTTVEAVHQVSLKISEFDAHASAILERMKEEYNLDASQQTPESMNLAAEFDVVAAHERINYLKERVESFGPVNLVAFSSILKRSKGSISWLVSERTCWKLKRH